MDVLRRLARSRVIPAIMAFGLLCSLSGCAEWLTNLSDPDAWAKLSPGNIWYNMQPHRLERLNYEDGLPTDVYYSVPDPIAPEPSNWDPSPSTVVQPPADHQSPK